MQNLCRRCCCCCWNWFSNVWCVLILMGAMFCANLDCDATQSKASYVRAYQTGSWSSNHGATRHVCVLCLIDCYGWLSWKNTLRTWEKINSNCYIILQDLANCTFDQLCSRSITVENFVHKQRYGKLLFWNLKLCLVSCNSCAIYINLLKCQKSWFNVLLAEGRLLGWQSCLPLQPEWITPLLLLHDRNLNLLVVGLHSWLVNPLDRRSDPEKWKVISLKPICFSSFGIENTVRFLRMLVLAFSCHPEQLLFPNQLAHFYWQV